MKRLIFYTFTGLIAYAIFLVTQAPAAFLFEQAQKYQPGLQADTLSGTLWQGAAQGLYLPLRKQNTSSPDSDNSIPALNLSWRWRPLALFSGLLAFQIHATGSEIDLAADMAFDKNRQLNLSDLGGEIALSRVANWIGELRINGELPHGQLVLNGAELGFNSQGHILFVNAQLSLRDIQLSLGDNLHLGDYTARLITKAQFIEAEIKDQGGPVELSGLLQLKPEGNYGYRFSGQLGLRDSASAALRQAFALLGRPAADGKWPFNITGTISQ